MHRAYQPITPANNKLLKKRWDTENFHTHRKKVDHAVSVIDNNPPRTYMHLHLKLKNLQIEEERIATVERDNRILLEKMSYIMRTRGSVDNRNYYQPKSLNKVKRQRELLSLTRDNQSVLKRITSREATYSHHQWDEDWNAKQKYMDNIAKYPKYWHRKSKTDLPPIQPMSSSSQSREKESSISKSDEEEEKASDQEQTDEKEPEKATKSEPEKVAEKEPEKLAEKEPEKVAEKEPESQETAKEETGQEESEEPAQKETEESQETDLA